MYNTRRDALTDETAPSAKDPTPPSARMPSRRLKEYQLNIDATWAYSTVLSIRVRVYRLMKTVLKGVGKVFAH